MWNIHLRLSLLITLFFFAAVPTLPAVDSRSDEKKYFTHYAVIYYSQDEDLHRFAANIGTGLSFLIDSPKKDPRLAAHRVDALVDRVMAILDMPMPGLRFSIRVFHEQGDLDVAYLARARKVPAPAAFYDPETAIIGIAADNLNANILAHEITHAVIDAWFSSPPPERVHEILAQYVDRHLGEE